MSTDVAPALDLGAIERRLQANTRAVVLASNESMAAAIEDLSNDLRILIADARWARALIETQQMTVALASTVVAERDEARTALDKVRELTRGLRVTVGAIAHDPDVAMEDEIHDLWLTIDEFEAALGPARTAPASAPAPAPLRRGDLVVRRGQEGTVVYVDETSWVVVGANRLDEEDNRGPDFSAGWGDTPEAAGWVRA